jgi:hypothetical protein
MKMRSRPMRLHWLASFLDHLLHPAVVGLGGFRKPKV